MLMGMLAVLAALLAVAKWRATPRQGVQLAGRIDELLPQTQCGKCGYGGCLPYARAIAEGEADINRCPPGGEETIVRLAELLGREPVALDPACGPSLPPRLAHIDEAVCIGCTKCIQACPVDAIVGASKQMHTVVDELCTGCELCLAPCPVDCIDMVLGHQRIADGWEWQGPPVGLAGRA